MQTLTKAKVVQMKDLIEVAGTAMDNVDAFAQRLGIKSTRTVNFLLKKWRKNLSEDDWNFLSSQALPDKTDNFPRMVISKSVIENENVLSTSEHVRDIMFDTIGGKSLYNVCVKVINNEKLKRMDTPWRDHLL